MPITICCNCKRIKHDGEWADVKVSDVENDNLTHGICPKCVKELYPDIADEVLGNG